ncbi:acetoacetate--CoA ligase [Bacillus thermotolerans]|uniref:acetoacetate--CoA ligase n=1 Tax=Bacillus thermotolerans TaxID=1221996 RepID=UPI00057E04CD|nr:acetoacetate--CoA ligase [Bacillus thermotolerans]KKB35394.1 Acetoacetyl-CoA synthetase [Bacillus thermotolerans]
MKTVTSGLKLWEPTPEQIEKASVSDYMNWLKEEKGKSFFSLQSLWEWSVTDIEGFWASVWEYCKVQSSQPYERVLDKRQMPGAKWFAGSRLNYAEHVFRNTQGKKPALIFQAEHKKRQEVSWEELQEKTAAVASSLKALGVKPGDRVAAYMPNIPEAVIAFLACASIGAVWSSCSPDFGIESVIDRFKQIEPVVLFAVDGYQYNGKTFDRLPHVAQLEQAIPSVRRTILVPYISSQPARISDQCISWKEAVKPAGELSFEQVPFDHPLWILYSSGTTGLPKAIVQGHGGILLEHLKTLQIEQNIGKDDVFFWYTTTGWMMWNFLVGNLMVGATIVLYDGSPSYPSLEVLWELAEEIKITYFGTSAGFIHSCMKSEVKPGETRNLSHLRAVASTGSPLSNEGFAWIYESVKKDVWLASISGGTDVCTAFVSGSPVLPVYAGEIQTRALGASIQSFDENGKALTNEVGELVITEPMPSMPVYFWNDEKNKRYHDSYFDVYPGIWRHGDWIRIDEKGSCVIYGRSDSTINKGGVRLGTSEIYRAVEAVDGVVDSLVVDLESLGRDSFMPLFVVLKEGMSLTDERKQQIRAAIKQTVSPRFIPSEIYEVSHIPKTISGKKLEVPVRKILLGMPAEKVVNRGSVANPDSLDFFFELAKDLNKQV